MDKIQVAKNENDGESICHERINVYDLEIKPKLNNRHCIFLI